MKYFYFIMAIISYVYFAYDLEHDRDFFTWLNLGNALIFSYSYHKEANKEKFKTNHTMGAKREDFVMAFLIAALFLLLAAAYKFQQLKKEINRLEADYIILLETCKGNEQ